MRLDRLLVQKGLVHSRNKAQELICEGSVRVDGKVVKKASFIAGESASISIDGPALYVSRAARKLEGFLKVHPVDIGGKRCLDVGASTGGFTQVLLQRGASSVTALDVGRLQLHEALRSDSRVVSVEQTDIRGFETEKRFEVTTCDVSFISLRNILPDLERLTEGVLILLFKPQFEVGIEAARDKRGVVTDDRAVAKAMREFEEEASRIGWREIAKAPSSLPGKEGNREWFYLFVNG
ncbi:RNA binding methyltransferase FtsJ like [Hydrogenimonas sp.]|nr:RNA binding methyltransferase FtsJ like [Hydrogenimonas sp.]